MNHQPKLVLSTRTATRLLFYAPPQTDSASLARITNNYSRNLPTRSHLTGSNLTRYCTPCTALATPAHQKPIQNT
jgi:hypothetical protein